MQKKLWHYQTAVMKLHIWPIPDNDLRITEEGDVDVIGDGDEPQRVAEQGGDEPIVADQDVVEEQLHEVEDHQ